jgi:riboflavin kinase
MFIKGKVLDGLGKGKNFVKIPFYNFLFSQLLLANPFPGTLNIALQESIQFKHFIRGNAHHGGLWYRRAFLFNIPILIIRPFKTTHLKNIVEIVSSWHLRTLFNLKNNNEVSLFLLE